MQQRVFGNGAMHVVKSKGVVCVFFFFLQDAVNVFWRYVEGFCFLFYRLRKKVRLMTRLLTEQCLDF